MTEITTYLSILTLNVNGLNSPIKRHRTVIWIKKQHPTNCWLQEMYLTNKNKHSLRVKEWIKIFQANGPIRQAGITILMSDKVEFKPKFVQRDENIHILRKETIHQEELAIVNI
jgi:exonuclease III